MFDKDIQHTSGWNCNCRPKGHYGDAGLKQRHAALSQAGLKDPTLYYRFDTPNNIRGRSCGWLIFWRVPIQKAIIMVSNLWKPPSNNIERLAHLTFTTLCDLVLSPFRSDITGRTKKIRPAIYHLAKRYRPLTQSDSPLVETNFLEDGEIRR